MIEYWLIAFPINRVSLCAIPINSQFFVPFLLIELIFMPCLLIESVMLHWFGSPLIQNKRKLMYWQKVFSQHLSKFQNLYSCVKQCMDLEKFPRLVKYQTVSQHFIFLITFFFFLRGKQTRTYTMYLSRYTIHIKNKTKKQTEL